MKKYDVNTFVGANILESIKSLCIGDVVKNDMSVYNINNQNVWYHFNGRTIVTSPNFRKMREYVDKLLAA